MTHPRSPRSRRRRGWLTWVLIGCFVVLPLAEIWAILQVGKVVGAGWTLALLVLDSLIGGWIIKREGGRAWTALRQAIEGGRMPARELADAALILVGGTLMLTPGFITDAAGVLLILPATRPIARRLLTTVVERRLVLIPENRYRPGPPADGPVVQGDVID